MEYQNKRRTKIEDLPDDHMIDLSDDEISTSSIYGGMDQLWEDTPGRTFYACTCSASGGTDACTD